MRVRPCACGACDHRAQPPSRYHGDHFRRLVAARKKWRRLKRYAELHGIPFELRLEQVLSLIHQRWPDTSFQLRRADRTQWFVAENLIVVDRRPHSPPTRDRLLLERAYAALRWRRLADRRGVEEVLEAYARQRGRCAVSGRKLRVLGRGTDGDALDIRPSASDDGPLVLVTRSVAEHELRWGARHLVDLAQAIVDQRDARRSKS